MTHVAYYNDPGIGYSRDLICECDDHHELTEDHFAACEKHDSRAPGSRGA